MILEKTIASMLNDQIKVCYLSLYIDNILLTWKDNGIVVDTKEWLPLNYEIQDMGEASFS